MKYFAKQWIGGFRLLVWIALSLLGAACDSGGGNQEPGNNDTVANDTGSEGGDVNGGGEQDILVNPLDATTSDVTSDVGAGSDVGDSSSSADDTAIGGDDSGETVADTTIAADVGTPEPDTTGDEDIFVPSIWDEFPTECTTGQSYPANKESALMRPGGDCIGCHAKQGGPKFLVGGTVFAHPHEIDNCYGVTGVTVELTDANGTLFTLVSNATGNFYASSKKLSGLQMPYTAKVITADGEREMVTPQDNGSCNSCHTTDGTNDAPGRILIP